MKILDPHGVEQRRRHRLRRRVYNVPGPLYVVHIDGHDKVSFNQDNSHILISPDMLVHL